MVRFVAPLLLLLEALAALVPAQGLVVCLGVPGGAGGAGGANEAVTTCDCGHHEAPASPAPDPDPDPADQDCGGCVDLELDSLDAVRPDLPGAQVAETMADHVAAPPASVAPSGCRPGLARAPGLRMSDPGSDAPPISARVLRERATVQLRR